MSIEDVHLEPPDMPGPRGRSRQRGVESAGVSGLTAMLLAISAAISGALVSGYFTLQASSDATQRALVSNRSLVQEASEAHMQSLIKTQHANNKELIQTVIRANEETAAALLGSLKELYTQNAEELSSTINKINQEKFTAIIRSAATVNQENNATVKQIFDNAINQLETRQKEFEEQQAKAKQDRTADNINIVMADIVAALSELLEIINRFNTERHLSGQGAIESYEQLASFVEVYDIRNFLAFADSLVYPGDAGIVYRLVPDLGHETSVKIILFTKKMNYLKQALSKEYSGDDIPTGRDEIDPVEHIVRMNGILGQRNQYIYPIIKQVHSALALGVDVLINMENQQAELAAAGAVTLDGSVLDGLVKRYETLRMVDEEELNFYPKSVIRKAENVKTAFLEMTLISPEE